MTRPAILVLASSDVLGAICDALAERDTYEIVVPDLSRPELLAETHVDGIISSYEIGRDLGSVMVELPATPEQPIMVTVRGITVGVVVNEDALTEALDVLDQLVLGADLESGPPIADVESAMSLDDVSVVPITG